ncbi:hypothetical protein HN51_028431 [Arachis hypogaea]|nr:TMV resistance protein N [Arachis hypogaea]
MERESTRSRSIRIWKHEVFVSFRGEDTRNNFIDHLFAAFDRKGIDAFKDDINLKQGGHISTELMEAIETSTVLMVVLSKNYASSTWCLRELEKILECAKVHKTSQTVLPVFYDVTPSEVRTQSGDYEKAFAELERRFERDLGMVQKWREAMAQVAAFSGWDVQNKPQHTEIEKIVERVIDIQHCKSSNLDGLVGMHPRVEELEKLLDFDCSSDDDDVRVTGICGMGGIGKSTLARVVFQRNLHRFSVTCILDNLSQVFHRDGLVGAQKLLVSHILKDEMQHMWSLSKAMRLMKARLCRVKALIVLDNVDSEDQQLEELGLNPEYLFPGSRIIVISRDKHILKMSGVDEIYEAQLLNKEESYQLFCRKVFRRNNFMLQHCDELLVDGVLKYAQGLPLAIEVLGSFLKERSMDSWKSILSEMRVCPPHEEIMDVLKISYDQLDCMEKQVFLDIACIFHDGSDKEEVMRILDCCGFFADIAVCNLHDKSLITINKNEGIEMHGKLRELGMEIVRKEALMEPGKRSRIWRFQDFLNVCENKAMDYVEAIRLESQTMDEKNTTLSVEALSKMNQLRLLKINDVKFSGNLSCLSSKLRYLEWAEYPYTYFPPSCEPSNLVELSLPHSSIKQLWNDIKCLYNLKSVDLHGSQNLIKIPDFSKAPNLEMLNLEGCTKLVHIHPSVRFLEKLSYLNLKNCTSLVSIPNRILSISSLQVVNLAGCSKLWKHSRKQS